MSSHHSNPNNEDKFWGTVWALGIIVALVGLSILLWMKLGASVG